MGHEWKGVEDTAVKNAHGGLTAHWAKWRCALCGTVRKMNGLGQAEYEPAGTPDPRLGQLPPPCKPG